MPRLIPGEPFPPKVVRYIEHYLDTRDADKAAGLAGLDTTRYPKVGRQLYKNALVRAEIDRKLEMEDKEAAHLRATARALTTDKLDTELVACVANEKGYARVRAIELGYRRMGVIHDGEFIPANAPQSQNSNNPRPSIYRALGTMTMRRVTEEVVQTREITAATPEPATIEAALPAPARPAIEILEY